MDVVGGDGTRPADSHQLLRRKHHLLLLAAECQYGSCVYFILGSCVYVFKNEPWRSHRSGFTCGQMKMRQVICFERIILCWRPTLFRNSNRKSTFCHPHPNLPTIHSLSKVDLVEIPVDRHCGNFIFYKPLWHFNLDICQSCCLLSCNAEDRRSNTLSVYTK